MPIEILIVDDDPAVAAMLYRVVQGNGYQADVAESGEEAMEKMQRREYALLLLDINLKGMDGFEVIQQLRDTGRKIPIIVVSGRKEEYDTIYGLDIGADDYITKPFNPVILGAKLKAMIRRSQGSLTEDDNTIAAGPFSYHSSTLWLFKNGEEITLTGKENAMMKLFLDNKHHIFSRDALYEMVWGGTLVDDNAVMVYINRLRQKIEDNPDKPRYIQTVRGVGYRFVP